jgi:hypothetical protein
MQSEVTPGKLIAELAYHQNAKRDGVVECSTCNRIKVFAMRGEYLQTVRSEEQTAKVRRSAGNDR